MAAAMVWRKGKSEIMNAGWAKRIIRTEIRRLKLSFTGLRSTWVTLQGIAPFALVDIHGWASPGETANFLAIARKNNFRLAFHCSEATS